MTQGQAYPLLFRRCESVSRARCVTEREERGEMKVKKKKKCCGLTCFYGFKYHYGVSCDEKLDVGNKMQRSALINMPQQPMEPLQATTPQGKNNTCCIQRKLSVYDKERSAEQRLPSHGIYCSHC